MERRELVGCAHAPFGLRNAITIDSDSALAPRLPSQCETSRCCVSFFETSVASTEVPKQIGVSAEVFYPAADSELPESAEDDATDCTKNLWQVAQVGFTSVGKGTCRTV